MLLIKHSWTIFIRSDALKQTTCTCHILLRVLLSFYFAIVVVVVVCLYGLSVYVCMQLLEIAFNIYTRQVSIVLLRILPCSYYFHPTFNFYLRLSMHESVSVSESLCLWCSPFSIFYRNLNSVCWLDVATVPLCYILFICFFFFVYLFVCLFVCLFRRCCHIPLLISVNLI